MSNASSCRPWIWLACILLANVAVLLLAIIIGAERIAVLPLFSMLLGSVIIGTVGGKSNNALLTISGVLLLMTSSLVVLRLLTPGGRLPPAFAVGSVCGLLLFLPLAWCTHMVTTTRTSEGSEEARKPRTYGFPVISPPSSTDAGLSNRKGKMENIDQASRDTSTCGGAPE